LTLFDDDIAAMIWIPLHFAITPLLGFIVSIMGKYRGRTKELKFTTIGCHGNGVKP
jgi:hypothetical protein